AASSCVVLITLACRDGEIMAKLGRGSCWPETLACLLRAQINAPNICPCTVNRRDRSTGAVG
ncbi:MAG: hypothetical protein ABSA65_19695, partial [Acidimicrobiales bacterium]